MLPLDADDTVAVKEAVWPIITELDVSVTEMVVAGRAGVPSAVYNAPPSIEPNPVARS
jgi:hypothetical protein